MGYSDNQRRDNRGEQSRGGRGFGGDSSRGGRDFGRRSFSGEGGRGSFNKGGRDGRRPEMFDAICEECNRDCKVPFRPTGGKPVYCSECFGGTNDSGPQRRSGRDFGKTYFEDRRTYPATCEECGEKCQVPFKPAPGKPVYCDGCFEPGRDKSEKLSLEQLKEHFDLLNSKLDRILKAVIPVIKVEKNTGAKVEEKTQDIPAKKDSIEKKTEKEDSLKKAKAPKKETNTPETQSSTKKGSGKKAAKKTASKE